MKRGFKTYHANVAFIDLLFNTVLGFAVFFIIAFILMSIQKSQSESNIKTKAEFVVTLTWDTGSKDDIDLWIKDPEDHIMFFRVKEIGLMHLDRDDLGQGNNSIITSDGRTIEIPERQELGTIRGIIPGEWIVNVHMYNKRTVDPANVTVKIDKLNPVTKIIVLEKFTMSVKGEEVTVVRMDIGLNGEVISANKLPYSMVEKRLISSESGMER